MKIDFREFTKDYIDSEEKEYCRMIDEYDREFEKEEWADGRLE